MSDFIISKTQSVELPIQGVASPGNQQTTFQFTPQTFLNDKLITSIEVFTREDVPTSPLNNQLVTLAQLQQCYLNLYFVDPHSENRGVAGIYIQLRPLITFHRVHTGTGSYVWEIPQLEGQIITWEKSSITVTGAPFSNTTNLAFLFDVGYQFQSGQKM